MGNQEAVSNLFKRGFFPVPVSGKGYDVFSKEGEVLCQMKNGVEYVLRFGEIVLGATGGGQGEQEEGQEEDKGTDINRYIFVMARFNENVIQKPEIEELPNLPEIDEADGEETNEELEHDMASDAHPSEA